MRGLIGACLALGTLSNVAAAADLGGSPNSDPYKVLAPLWSGLYVSAAVGYGSGNSRLAVVLPSGTTSTTEDMGLRGQHGAVTVGYDFRLDPRWVIGLFADYAIGTTEFSTDASISIDNQWAIGGRLGLLATPSTLLYASAGYTGADIEATQTGLRTLAKGTVEGYFVGLGGEQALSRNVFLKVDYRFSAYEDITNARIMDIPVTLSDNRVHSLRLGVSYRFGM